MRSITLLLAAALLTGCVSYHARQPGFGADPGDRRRETALTRIMIPMISVSNAPVADVIGQLVLLSAEHDPEHAGCSIVLDMTPTPDQQSGENKKKIWGASEVRITLRLQETPFLTVVDALCRQAGLVWRLETIVIVTTPENYEDWKKHRTTPSTSPGSTARDTVGQDQCSACGDGLTSTRRWDTIWNYENH